MTSTPPLPEEEPVAHRGRGIKIAVIDSGVHVGHPHIARVAGGVSVHPDGAIEDGSFADTLGHGTAVIAAIQEKAGAADYFAVKIFHGSLRCSSQALLRAIEWTIEQRMDLVNLSLGTRNAAHAERLAVLVERALRSGVTFVSPREMDGQPCFPGCLPGVIGVILDEQCDRYQYRVQETADGPVAFAASGYPRPAPGIPRERNLQGISFAAANMTGFAALALDGMETRSYELLRTRLMECGR